MDDAQLAKELAKAEKAFRASTERQESAKVKRNELVWQAIAANWTYEDIAEASKLSRQRVAQIAQLSPSYRRRGRQEKS